MVLVATIIISDYMMRPLTVCTVQAPARQSVHGPGPARKFSDSAQSAVCFSTSFAALTGRQFHLNTRTSEIETSNINLDLIWCLCQCLVCPTSSMGFQPTSQIIFVN